jgi:hypothetical protein
MIIATFLIPLYYTKFSHSAITSEKRIANIISQKCIFQRIKSFSARIHQKIAKI